MTTTRRLSGLQGGSHQQTSLMLDSYEAFKRKHLAQNKEIIQKNSELHKANADLQRQISLMRAERLSLKGTQFQLECENAALRDKLDRCEERERRLIDERDRLKRKGGGVLDDGQVEAMQRLLAQTIAHLQAFGLMLPSSASLAASPAQSNTSFVAPESPLASTSAAGPAASSTRENGEDPSADPSTVTTRRRSLAAARAARPSMTAPPDLSNITEGDGSAEEEDSVDQMRRSLDWRGPVLAQCVSFDALSQPRSLPKATKANKPAGGGASDECRGWFDLALERASTIGLEPPAAEAPVASSRSTRGRVASVWPAPEEPAPVAVQPGHSTLRPALREIQSPPPSTSPAPAAATKPTKRPVVEQLQPRQPRKTSTAPPAPAKSDANGVEKEDGRGAALLKAKKDAVRTQRAKQAEEQHEQSEAQDGAVDEEVEEDRSGSVAEETMSGPRSRKAPKKVEELEVLSEEGTNSQPNEQDEEPAAGGRRARKSVNYALPKLNTKMRRPADYVPVTKPSTTNKPRKSTKSGGLGSSSTSSAPVSTASTEYDVEDAPAPRTASLAGKKPVAPTSDESDAEEAVVVPRSTRALDASTSSEDEWNEQQFLRRSSIVPSASSSRSQAGQDLEERRRQRQAQKEQLAKLGGSGNVGGRRHSVAVCEVALISQQRRVRLSRFTRSARPALDAIQTTAMSKSPSAATAPSYPVALRLVTSISPILRLTQNASAATVSIFAIVHLAAPLSALLPSRPQYLTSAENRANGFALLGREVYQGEWSEPVLVWGSLTAHVVSGIALRWLRVVERVERRKARKEEAKRKAREMATIRPGEVEDELPTMTKATEVEKNLVEGEVEELEAELVATTTNDEELVVPASVSPAPLVPLPTFHQTMGYALIPFVAHHAWLHRLLPSSPLPPIFALSPSFFNYSFTAFSLRHDSPLLKYGSAVCYAAVVGLGTYHGLVGWRILLDPTAPRSLAPSRRRPGGKDRRVLHGREWQAAWVTLVAGVSVGAARIAGYLGGERSVRVPDFVVKRMDFVLRRGFAQA
uniref:BY PROTMAP: gi/342320452/gb/EGU12392.1/ Proteophosphoglycan ppg4 [Rhodotorula glutinis ATCC 204091] n=1 Tax=Rhodotorula toruloides TaxID=5286 RepID=A0A0K3CLJ0_RHOTO